MQFCFITHTDNSPSTTYHYHYHYYYYYSTKIHNSSLNQATSHHNQLKPARLSAAPRYIPQHQSTSPHIQWPSSATSSTCRPKTFLLAPAHHQPALCLRFHARRNRLPLGLSLPVTSRSRATLPHRYPRTNLSNYHPSPNIAYIVIHISS